MRGVLAKMGGATCHSSQEVFLFALRLLAIHHVGVGKKTSLSSFDTPTKLKAISLSAALYFKWLPTCLSFGRDLRLPHS